MINNNPTFNFERKTIIGWAARLAFSALIAAPFWWANSVLNISAIWAWTLVLVVIASSLPDTLWVSRRRMSPVASRLMAFALLIAVPLLTTLSTTQRHLVMAGSYAITVLILLGLSFAYSQKSAAANIGLSLMGIVFAVIIANIAAGIVLNILEQPRTQQVPPTPQPQIALATALATDASTEATPTAELPPATPAPTADPDATPEPTPEPTPELPIAGYGYMDFLTDGGEAEWTQFTGYGPRINSSVRAYMYDANGQIVYNTVVEWNSKGMRGPDVSYEKPDNTYRILIIGDSFVEAIQEPYENTFPALLQAELDQHSTADRQYEVIAMGRTGWGTLHELIYYQVEGYKFDADLVILNFYINDVADNFPRVFYPNINNTNYEFVFDNDGSVHILDTNNQPIPPNHARLLYNALPLILQQSNLARLFVRAGDPPIPVVTPGGVLTRVHPQYFIYVDEPEVEGYSEAWQRTERALRQFAADTDRNGSQFAVTSIFIGEEMIENVSNWYPDMTEGYQWNADRPDQLLAQILEETDASLIRTRPAYEAHADEVGGDVYDLLFLPEDGHFNALGHQLTADLLFEWLVDQGIVQ